MVSHAEIFPEAVDLMHALMQDRYDADLAVREPTPVDEVPFLPEEATLDPELGWDRLGFRLVSFDAVECLEQAGDVAVGLSSTSTIPRVAIDLIESV